MNKRYSIIACLALAAFTGQARALPPLDEFIQDGRLRDGLAAYAAPANDAERFSLAVLQALDGLQQFSTGFNKLGLNPLLARSGLPFLRAIVSEPSATAAEAATPETTAALFRNFQTSLQGANATLAGMGDEEFGVTVNVSQARMDLDGDGAVATNEMLLASLGRPLGLPAHNADGSDVVIRFDRADAAWLRGYTHFLSGILEILTAYDWMPAWNQCAHVVFSNPQPVPPIALHSAAGERGDIRQAADFIAAIHEMRLELVRQDGLRRARDDFRAMVACSRTCWERVLAETDDDHEWLPAPAQAGPGGAKVSTEQIEGWQQVLNELEAILNGDKLLPHWRVKPGEGINLDKLVEAPPRLDPVLLIQGSALIPYLQEGPISDRNTWRQLLAPFGPGFARFAVWSN